MIHGIVEARAAIRQIKAVLRNAEVTIDDLPDDEETLLNQAVSVEKAITTNQLSKKPIAYRFLPEADSDSREARYNILYVSNVIDSHKQELEQFTGKPDTTDIVNIGSLEEIPAGGLACDYQFDNYILSISYDREGVAKSVRLEGLAVHNYSLYDWFQALHRLGVSIGTQPDVVGVMSATWRDYHGYNITVALDKVNGVINIIRVYKIPR